MSREHGAEPYRILTFQVRKLKKRSKLLGKNLREWSVMEQSIKSVSRRKRWNGTPCHLPISSPPTKIPATHHWVGQSPSLCIVLYVDCHTRM